MTYLYLIFGLVLLFVGGDLLVRGSVAVAKKLGVSTIMIGLTLVGFGTSTPELVTSIKASLIGSPGIAIGNVVGSNIANILLVLGVAGILAPVNKDKKIFKRDSIMLIISTFMFYIITRIGYIDKITGIIFIIVLILYLVYTYTKEKNVVPTEPIIGATSKYKKSIFFYLFLAVLGIAATIYGADLLVTAAIDIARSLDISETIIGLTIVAVGTSLPELSATVMAAIKKEPDIALGNIIGSNIYNILFILGVTGIINRIDIPESIIRFDIWALAIATIFLLSFIAFGRVLNRKNGIGLLIFYAIYIYILNIYSA